MRYLLGLIGGLAALALVGVSLAMNYQFATTLGAGEWEKATYGVASASADLLKIVLPFAIASAWLARKYIAAGLSAIALVIFASWSFASAIGFASLNRAETSGDVSVAASRFAGVKSDLETQRKALAWVPAHRPASTVAADIDRLKLNPRWGSSKGCTDATHPASRALCGQIATLKAELGAAESAGAIQARIVALTAQLAQTGGVAASTGTDPQIATITALLSWARVDAKDVTVGLALVLAVLIEFGSTLGLYAVAALFAQPAALGKPKQREISLAAPANDIAKPPAEVVKPEAIAQRVLPWKLPPKEGAKAAPSRPAVALKVVGGSDAVDSVGTTQEPGTGESDLTATRRAQCAQFAQEALVINGDNGSRIVAMDLYRSFEAWATDRDVEVMHHTQFGWLMTELLAADGVTRQKSNGRQMYCGLKFAEAASMASKAA